MQKNIQGLFNNSNSIDLCRICGQRKMLTEEHIIPRIAGGGNRTEFYSPIDILNDPNTKQRLIKQKGICDLTLCKECNEKIGHMYDVYFSDFLKLMNAVVHSAFETGKNEGVKINELINKGSAFFELKNIAPFNIAKRILASFCSIERYQLVEQLPEIKKAILDKEYKPDIKNFSIYLCIHTGNCAFFSDVCFMHKDLKILKYSGIEYGYTGIYFMRNRDGFAKLEDCLDITNWLKDYNFNQKVNMKFALPIHSSMVLNIEIPKKLH